MELFFTLESGKRENRSVRTESMFSIPDRVFSTFFKCAFRKLWRSTGLLNVSLSVFSVGAFAQSPVTEEIAEGLHMYARNDAQLNAIPYWGETIQVQVLSPTRLVELRSVALTALSEIVHYSALSNTEVDLAGHSDFFTARQTVVHRDTNFLVGIVRGIESETGVAPEYLDPFDYSANTVMKEISVSSAQRVAKGCFGQWSIDENHVVSGFAILIDQDLDAENMSLCVQYLVPYSFGMRPEGFALPFDAGNDQDDVWLMDRSSVGLRLQAAELCRTALGNRTEGCANQILDRFYRAYGEIGRWYD